MVADDWEEKRQRKGWGTTTGVMYGVGEAEEAEGEGSDCGRHVAGKKKKRATRSSKSCYRGGGLLVVAGGAIDTTGQQLVVAIGKEEEKGRSIASAAVCRSRRVRLL
ncbi:hypothetical protein B296_00018538 [Ensete ventricosum]|uniref:Uncharacterized protein n=1 Tax=Ensete ventricosum TaxID=4639 RepID=A0A427AIT9_ENSVE|nr:hypothetical protein B296_00018538 [Ensete ventricosum]